MSETTLKAQIAEAYAKGKQEVIEKFVHRMWEHEFAVSLIADITELSESEIREVLGVEETDQEKARRIFSMWKKGLTVNLISEATSLSQQEVKRLLGGMYTGTYSGTRPLFRTLISDVYDEGFGQGL